MISVVTVNYKTIDYTMKMLSSLFAFHQDEIEVFVVENGSGDDMSPLRESFPQVRVIESEKNLGFAGGCNLAIKESAGEFVVLINPDVVFTSPSLYELRDVMRADSGIGVGGVSLKNMDGTQQRCVWSFPQPIDQLILLLKLHHVFSFRSIRRWQMLDFDYSQSADVDQVMGAFFMIQREVLDAIGLLDDGFFMWYEEVDFCRRAVNAGWRVRYVSTSSALHKRASSFDQILTVKKQSMLRRSLRRYMRKHHLLAWPLFILFNPLFWLTGRLAALVKKL